MVVCSMICLTFDKLIDQCVLAINTTVLSWVLVLVVEFHPNSNQSDLVHGPPSGSQVLPMSRGVFPWNSFKSPCCTRPTKKKAAAANPSSMPKTPHVLGVEV